MNISYLIKQKSYEKVKFALRRHPITFIPQLLLLTVALVVPALVYLMISNIYPELFDSERLYALGIIAGSIYYLSVLLFGYGSFIDFYLDVWIVTNDRVVDIEQFGLFSRTISELDLFRIQDVTTDVHGLFSTIFKYGDVTLKTASTNLSIVFKNVPDPNHIRMQLLELAHEDFKYHRGQL
ncbi:MAG: PH domain-containing protein [bacterium]|nr:PH domain-containing protein [bacterium]